MAFFSQELAIDLGTANTVIFKDDKIVLDEPSIIAVEAKTGKLMAIGTEAQLIEEHTNARIYTLDNGLKVYMIVNKDEPRIDAHVAVKVGSKNDPQETTGLAHYFEHLMFKGTE